MALDRFGSNVHLICKRGEITTTAWNPRRHRYRSGTNDVAIRPEYRVPSSTTVAIEAHATDAIAMTAPTSSAVAGGYGSSERQVGVSVNTNVGQLYASGSVAGGYAIRTIGANASILSEQKSPKITWNTMGSWRGAKSTIEVQGRMEETRNAGGGVTRPSQISVRGSRSLSGSASRGASVDFELQQVRGFSARA